MYISIWLANPCCSVIPVVIQTHKWLYDKSAWFDLQVQVREKRAAGNLILLAWHAIYVSMRHSHNDMPKWHFIPALCASTGLGSGGHSSIVCHSVPETHSSSCMPAMPFLEAQVFHVNAAASSSYFHQLCCLWPARLSMVVGLQVTSLM